MNGMGRRHLLAGLLLAIAASGAYLPASSAHAQNVAAATASAGEAGTLTAEEAGTPLSEEELEILVARIALYPDELVAVITAASLYPLQVVEAGRFLASFEKDPSLQPKTTWDGSIISLLNYPQIVTMMSDDLDWTQALGNAIAYQQKDVLIAIQQLRDQAVANGIIKSDDKVTVVNEGDNVVIQSAQPETIYVPQYPPEMLYEPNYPPAPIVYYPDPYPPYYHPTAPFFAAVVTGTIWAAVVDWDDWDVWGGDWDGGDIDIDCNNCFNDIDIDREININDIDWKNVDRDKISIDKDQFKKIDNTSIKTSIKANDNNSIRTKATEIKKERPTTLPDKSGKVKDVRTSTLEGLKEKPAARDMSRVTPPKKPEQAKPKVNNPKASNPTVGDAKATNPKVSRPKAAPSKAKKPATANRPIEKPKMAAKPDTRPKKPSGLGEVKQGKKSKVEAKRGGKNSQQLILPKPKAGNRR